MMHLILTTEPASEATESTPEGQVPVSGRIKTSRVCSHICRLKHLRGANIYLPCRSAPR